MRNAEFYPVPFSRSSLHFQCMHVISNTIITSIIILLQTYIPYYLGEFSSVNSVLAVFISLMNVIIRLCQVVGGMSN